MQFAALEDIEAFYTQILEEAPESEPEKITSNWKNENTKFLSKDAESEMNY